MKIHVLPLQHARRLKPGNRSSTAPAYSVEVAGAGTLALEPRHRPTAACAVLSGVLSKHNGGGTVVRLAPARHKRRAALA
jgi:hypothetical protein